MKHHRIPSPPHRPRYHDYATGSPGDDRSLEARLAERIARENDLDGDPGALAALEAAFRAGRACGQDDQTESHAQGAEALRRVAARRLAEYVVRHGNVSQEARHYAGFVLAENPEDVDSIRRAMEAARRAPERQEELAAERERLHDGVEPR